MTREIKLGNIKIGKDNPVVLIAGPCVIESESSAMQHAGEIKAIADKVGIPFIFKSSYDKANRTSVNSYRGPGIKKGLKILARIKKEFGVPVLSDVHCRSEIKEAAGVLDIIQIPAFLCRQTSLILAAARTKKPVNLKKGQFLAPWDIENAIRKIESTGNKNILITERGTTFGYNNLVSDFRSIVIMKEFGYPIIFDATHSVQMPGGMGKASGGKREFVYPLSLAAVAVGADALFLEVHKNPKKALSDGATMLFMKGLKDLLVRVKKVERAIK